ncbi:hypothetical protein [Spiroplasma endosymbiont of Nomada rufipes]|uniref:hypothetical protein n=1 Tax=Spiroplasma endosymbiont of Nomada rufipes TaxID=3077933 RepID=UPI00376EFE8B
MKRKLNYKKILIATGILVVVAAATTIAVVATKSTKSEAKKELSSIITKLEVDGNKFNTEETVLNEIIRLNEEITSEHVEIKNFITASEIKNGSAELHAKADSKYTGKVNITITAKDKIALDSKITNKEVDGNKFNTEKAVLDEIIKQNKDVTANDVEIKNFKTASEGTAGSAELHAKADSKYTGKVNITITAKDKIALDSKITNKTVDGNDFNTEKTVLDEIIKQNKDVTANDVEIKNFKAASEGTAGSAELHAKADSKYTGKVNITITAKDKIALDSKITNKTVDGNDFNTEKTVLDEIIKQNKDVTANDVEIKNFKAASEGTAGSAELHAKADSKYTGKVNIIITKVDTEEERLEKIIKKIKVANDKERYGKEYVEAYKEYFAFLEKTMEAKFKIDPWVTDQEPTDSNKSSTFYKLENYMREIRISHYRLGLVEQRINRYYKKNRIIINNENKTISFNSITMNMYKTEDSSLIRDSSYSITATIKYQVK